MKTLISFLLGIALGGIISGYLFTTNLQEHYCIEKVR